MGQDAVGFYSLSQLASCRETQRQRGRIGVLPLGKKQILRLVNAGKFPAPVGRMSGQLIWRKEDIHEYTETLAAGA